MKNNSVYLYEYCGIFYPVTSVRFGKRSGKYLHTGLVSTYRFKQILEKDIASSMDDVRREAERIKQLVCFFVPRAALLHPHTKLLTHLNNDESLNNLRFVDLFTGAPKG